MHTELEYGYKVAVLPPAVLMLARPLFKVSMPHRGRILRFGAKRRGPVLRDWYGRF